ncbi:hypothetical protein PMAYCL1PPCAC_24733, partial [Pristionchus mayeri]
MACLGSINHRNRNRERPEKMASTSKSQSMISHPMGGFVCIELDGSEDDKHSIGPISKKRDAYGYKQATAATSEESNSSFDPLHEIESERRFNEQIRSSAWATPPADKNNNVKEKKQMEKRMEEMANHLTRYKKAAEHLLQNEKKEKEKLVNRMEEMTDDLVLFKKGAQQQLQKEKKEKGKLVERIEELSQCKDGPQQLQQEWGKVHFKMTQDGVTRRFGLS